MATKMIFALLSLHTVTTMVAISRGPRNLPGSSIWAGTKREAPLVCLHVFTGVRVENLPVPDTPQGVRTAEQTMLDVEKTVLYQQWELPPGKSPPAPPHHPWEMSLWKQCPLAVAQQEQRSCHGQAPSHHQDTHHHPPISVMKAPRAHARPQAQRPPLREPIPSLWPKHPQVTSPILCLVRVRGASVCFVKGAPGSPVLPSGSVLCGCRGFGCLGQL